MKISGDRIVVVFLLILASILLPVTVSEENQTTGNDTGIAIHSSITIVIGIFFIILTLTFLVIIYIKFCSANARRYNRSIPGFNSLLPNNSRLYAGLDKSIIESLPLFRFSDLKGSREGLECSVCLSVFDESEFLRLLPKCKHAFHTECIDKWLENNSSCPLCRYKVEIEDLTLFKYSGSSRFLFRDPSSMSQRNQSSDLPLDLFVEREEVSKERTTSVDGINDYSSSRRFTIGGSFRKAERKKSKDGFSLLVDGDGKLDDRFHKLKHKIIISDAMFKNRWSDLNSSDLTSLNSDMLNDLSNRKFSSSERYSSLEDHVISKIKVDIERKRVMEGKMKIHGSIGDDDDAFESIPAAASSTTHGGGSSITSGRRCMSEMPNIPRSMDAKPTNQTGGEMDDDSMRKAWLPIARRTVQWFAGKERRSDTPNHVMDV
ncbi:E3 ubiquitin-protein ligase, ATL family [Zostera marina]|uniref:RING-type E3 ubiquitin transferase n=1 Tax=Zostera marina TaxID=29655 RepID=A0A0K9NGK4_ZOSMR|nr:E3 ubiquitin-protein ligase, ATL family [Zostera marina]